MEFKLATIIEELKSPRHYAGDLEDVDYYLSGHDTSFVQLVLDEVIRDIADDRAFVLRAQTPDRFDHESVRWTHGSPDYDFYSSPPERYGEAPAIVVSRDETDADHARDFFSKVLHFGTPVGISILVLDDPRRTVRAGGRRTRASRPACPASSEYRERVLSKHKKIEELFDQSPSDDTCSSYLTPLVTNEDA